MMLDNQSNNRRIAKNTAVIYLDMLLAVLIGLYTSRLALKTLGISDYGLFSVVGGIIGMFAIISSSLSNTTTRFVNVEMGRKDGDLNKVFNVCNVLHIIMAIILFLFLETGGVYYIHHFLKVETGKEPDAMFVFQVSTAMCSIGILNVPYSSLFNATEKFLFIAIVNLSVRITQLLLLIYISQYDGNRLRAYSLMMTLSTLTSFIIYHCYCYIYWHETVKW